MISNTTPTKGEIWIPYSTISGKESVRIRIAYYLERDEDNTTYFFEVLEAERPEWIKKSTYSAKEHYTPGDGLQPGVTVTDYNQQRYSCADEASFVSTAIAQIKFSSRINAS